MIVVRVGNWTKKTRQISWGYKNKSRTSGGGRSPRICSLEERRIHLGKVVTGPRRDTRHKRTRIKAFLSPILMHCSDSHIRRSKWGTTRCDVIPMQISSLQSRRIRKTGMQPLGPLFPQPTNQHSPTTILKLNVVVWSSFVWWLRLQPLQLQLQLELQFALFVYKLCKDTVTEIWVEVIERNVYFLSSCSTVPIVMKLKNGNRNQ